MGYVWPNEWSLTSREQCDRIALMKIEILWIWWLVGMKCHKVNLALWLSISFLKTENIHFLLNYLQCLWNHACLLCNHVLQLDWTIGPPWFRMKHICMILFDSKEDIVVSQHVSTIKGWKSICVFHSFFSVGSLARVSIMSILPSNPDKNISSGNTSWRC